MKTPLLALLGSWVVLTAVGAEPQPGDVPVGRKAVQPVELELFGKEAWYKEQSGKEQDFEGVLVLAEKKGGAVGFGRFNPYRLEMKDAAREVYLGADTKRLAPYVGQRLKLTGKPVDMEVEGKEHREIWPSRLQVLSAKGTALDDKAKEPAADAKPGKRRVINVQARAPMGGRPADGVETEPLGTVIRSADELAKVIGKDQAAALPKLLKVESIDYKTQMLIHVFGGQRNTGGYRVEVSKIEADDAAKSIHVAWKLHAPDGIATQVISYPGQIVLVERVAGEATFDPPADGKPREKKSTTKLIEK